MMASSGGGGGGEGSRFNEHESPENPSNIKPGFGDHGGGGGPPPQGAGNFGPRKSQQR